MAEKAIGRDIAPPDLRAKITGRAKYAEDFRAEGMLFAKLLLSPMPHCRVRRIDPSAALAMEGVVDILTADDPMMPEITGVAAEAALTMEPLYEGEPVLAVAAVDETTAADAIEAIRVDFEPLPFVVDPLDSLRPGGPNARLDGNIQWREGQTREIREFKWTDGDFDAAGPDRLPMGEPQVEWNVGEVEDGFADADLVLEETLLHQSLSHHPMEPRSVMAYWQNGKLYLHTSTQSTARTHAGLANRLGMDQSDVVLVTEYCGGGFGSKISGAPINDVAAIMSRKTGRPVMLRINRYEETYIGRARPGFQSFAKLGLRNDGRVT
ncbi:MAG: molybdopterin-dependent oxidoreductase, partial [Gammaproteobacteria bacterium]|nr:molybdopterin-dependent oxidoreductase [Gammaproteobacteria bacterium]